MWRDRDRYPEHNYIPDTFWLVIAVLLFAACGLVWLIGQVAAIVFGPYHQHLPVRLVDMLGVLLRGGSRPDRRSSARPRRRTVAGHTRWPGRPRSPPGRRRGPTGSPDSGRRSCSRPSRRSAGPTTTARAHRSRSTHPARCGRGATRTHPGEAEPGTGRPACRPGPGTGPALPPRPRSAPEWG
jgi:hypothetical protein